MAGNLAPIRFGALSSPLSAHAWVRHGSPWHDVKSTYSTVHTVWLQLISTEQRRAANRFEMTLCARLTRKTKEELHYQQFYIHRPGKGPYKSTTMCLGYKRLDKRVHTLHVHAGPSVDVLRVYSMSPPM